MNRSHRRHVLVVLALLLSIAAAGAAVTGADGWTWNEGAALSALLLAA